MLVRALRDGDLAPLLAIQHARAGEGARWSPHDLHRGLTNEAHGHGANVRVAERDGAVVGGAGWVTRGDAFFIAPLLAVDARPRPRSSTPAPRSRAARRGCACPPASASRRSPTC